MVFVTLSQETLARRLHIRSAVGCKDRMDPDKYLLVNQVCEECSAVFKGYPEIYDLCRMDCFGTQNFNKCMNFMLVEEELKNQLTSFVEDAHYNPFVVGKK